MPALITLTCPSCGAKANITENSLFFTCEYCGNQHMLQLSGPAAAVSAPAPFEGPVIKPRVPIPQSVKIERDGQSAVIIQRWFSAKYLALAVFAAVWDGFLIFWYAVVGSMGAPLIFKLFPVIHLAIGIYVTYTVLAGFFNRTVVELNQETLSVWIEPLPWPGEKTVKISELKQLYCKQQVKSGKNGPTYSYQLYAVTHNDQELKVIDGLDTPEVARFFEQQLESWLHISDRAVAGEYR